MNQHSDKGFTIEPSRSDSAVVVVSFTATIMLGKNDSPPLQAGKAIFIDKINAIANKAEMPIECTEIQSLCVARQAEPVIANELSAWKMEHFDSDGRQLAERGVQMMEVGNGKTLRTRLILTQAGMQPKFAGDFDDQTIAELIVSQWLDGRFNPIMLPAKTAHKTTAPTKA